MLTFEGESDAHIVRGLVAIVLSIFSGKRCLGHHPIDALDLFGRMGLIEYLTAQRANGLRSMVKRIKDEAARRLAAWTRQIPVTRPVPSPVASGRYPSAPQTWLCLPAVRGGA